MTSGFLCSQSGCASIQEEQQPHPVSDKTSEKLKAVLAEEIADIVKDGVSIPTLQQLHRFANVAQELLMVRSPLAEVRRRSRPSSGQSSFSFSGNSPGIIAGGNTLSAYQPMYGTDDCDQPLTQEAAPNETYGAKLIREIIPALSGLKDGAKKGKIEELVSAIAEANDAGLDDLVTTLKGKLNDLLAGKYLEDEGAEAGEPPALPAADTGDETHISTDPIETVAPGGFSISATAEPTAPMPAGVPQ